MSDCSANAWHVPEQREPGVLYDHGQPNYDYLQARAIVVGGVRFERVRECSVVNDIEPRDVTMRVIGSCSECGHILCGPDWCCAHCGAKVVGA